MYSAHDPVLAVEENRRVPGHTDYCVMYNGQLYMFSSSATLARFKESPEKYEVDGRSVTRRQGDKVTR
jgi:YHS domain-containing protein